MKSAILTLIVLASFIATLITYSQTDPAEADPFSPQNNESAPVNPKSIEAPNMIRVHAEFIEMSQPTYTKLMAKPRTSANDTDLRAECAKHIEKKEARIIESMCVTACPGQTTTSESILEFIHPTEYDPGEVPNEVNGQAAAPNSPFGSPPTPTAFDTKNTGSTFEVEALCDRAGKLVDLRCTPTLVYHIDNTNWGAEKASGAAGPVLIPNFYVLTAKIGATLVSGQPTIAATLTPKNEDGKHDPSLKVVLFLRADVLTVGE